MKSVARLVLGRKISLKVLVTTDCHVDKTLEDMPRQQFPRVDNVCLCWVLSSETCHSLRDSGSPSSHCNCSTCNGGHSIRISYILVHAVVTNFACG